MKLWFERPRALAELPAEGHGVIEASAGTGKTYTIEHLVVDLLRRSAQEKERSLRLEELLIVTYTNAATADLKKKIRERLSALVEAWLEVDAGVKERGNKGSMRVPGTDKGQAQYVFQDGRVDFWEGQDPPSGGPGEWVYLCDESIVLLRRGLRNFDQASIYTIHGFCQRVLTEHAFASGRLLEQEHRSEEEVYEEAMGMFLREEAALDEELRGWLEVYLAGGGTVEGLKEMLKTYGSQGREIQPHFDGERFKQGVEALLRIDSKALKTWEEGLKGAGIQTESIRVAQKHVGVMQSRMASVRGETTAKILLAAKDLSGPRAYFSRKGIGPKILKQDLALSKLVEFVLRTSTSFEAAMGLVYGAKIRARVERLKEEEGYFTYQDMLELVAESLRGEGQVLGSLRERFRFGVIDEFQDTDELQWEIFRRIFVEGGGRHRLYVVGDPKQSIYGFRGGDIFTYIDARDQLIGEAEPVFLRHNYRSRPEVIEAYNKIFTGPIELGEGITYAHPVEAGKERFQCRRGGPQGERVAALEVIELEGSDGAIDQVRRGMCRAMALRIAEILGDERGYWAGDEGVPESWRRLGAEDIYVLCRQNRMSLMMGEELRRLGVPVAFLKLDGLFQTREAEEIYELLRALENPGDRGARARAWMTAFFDLSLKDLERIGEIGEEGPVYQRLLRWSGLAFRRQYRELFREVVAESGLVRRQLLFATSERALTNYLHILEILEEEAEANHLEVGELARELKALMKGRRRTGGTESAQQRLEVEERAVNILTAHSSKGLQRGMVFYLPALSGIREKGELRVTVTVKGERRKVSWMAGFGAMPKSVAASYVEQARAEEHRLNYVAMTRPESLLVIPHIGRGHPAYKPAKGEVSRRIPYLDICDRLETLRRDAGFDSVTHWRRFDVDQVKEWAPPKEQVRRGLMGFARVFETMSEAVAAEERRWEEERAGEERLRGRRWEITSYSKLKETGLGVVESASERAGVDDPLGTGLGVTAEELPGGMNTGNFLHKVLEDLAYEEIGGHGEKAAFVGDEAMGAFFEQRARQYGISLKYVPVVMGVVYDTLRTSIPLVDSPLTRIPELWRLENTLKEMEFLFPIPQRGRGKSGGREAALQRRFEGLEELESGFVTGVIDLVFSYEGRVFFGDWKSDLCRDYQRATLKQKVEENYADQAKLYTLALLRVLGIETEKEYEARFGGLYYFFVRGMRPGSGEGVHYERIGWKDLMAYEQWLSKAFEGEDVGEGGRVGREAGRRR